MKEIKTCEDYVLAELEEKKAQVQKLTEVCKEYLEVRKTRGCSEMEKTLQPFHYCQRTYPLMVYVEKADKKGSQKPTQP